MQVLRNALAVLVILGFAGSAVASQFTNNLQDLRNEKSSNWAPSGTSNPPEGQVGGDNISTATVIGGLPYCDTGNTCSFTNDYDEVCPYTGSTSPDVVYRYNAPASGRLRFDLCDSGYDTKVYIYENGPGSLVCCNDDACSDPAGNQYRSLIDCCNVTAGNTYYIVVDGYFGDCGSYTLCVTECPPVEPCAILLPCLPEISEGEVDCSNGYIDAYNSGCSVTPPAFTPLTCDDRIGVCGTSGTFVLNGNDYRDTDWYELTLLPENCEVTICLCASFDAQLAVISGDIGCGTITPLCGPTFGQAFEEICCTYTTSGTVKNWLFVSPASFTGVPCGSPYDLSITREGCPCDTVVVVPPCSTDTWNLLATTGPAPRFGHAMVSDSERGLVVLFGGRATGGGYLNDTWEWDGVAWNLRTPTTSPDARVAHAMAYDASRQRVVLFGGGNATTTFGETWEWDGTNWVLVSSAGPPIRRNHVMAYDVGRKRVVLFGGGAPALGDTWEWNGSTWTQVASTGPSPRIQAAMAYVPQLGQTVLFGGSGPGGLQSDMWGWDGTVWTALAGSGPSARSRHAMAYSDDCGRLVMFGGNLPPTDPITWAWGGATWSDRGPGPGLLSAHAMAYDAARGRVLLFGGFDANEVNKGNTWEWCCECDEEVAVLDSLGNVVFPSSLDPDEPITYQDVDEDVGLVGDEFPDFETDADSWYADWPCRPAIGGEIPDGADEDALNDSLAALGIGVPSQEIIDSLAIWEDEILSFALGQAPVLPTASPTGPTTPYPAPASPYCPPTGNAYVFGGRDIVFVHGLKLDHIFDRIFGVPGAQVDWVPPTIFPGRTENPEFYNDNGYYRDIALESWNAHIQQFFTSRGIKNRYVVVTYPCNARFEVGIQAILTQIGDAMRFGTNVVDGTGRSDSTKFGTPSFVVVSHSTGGPITDAALWSAQSHPNLKAEFIASRCKAHVALAGAFGGSRFASAAVALSPVLTVGAGALSWLCPLVNIALVEFGNSPVTCPPNFAPVANSVLVDLSPRVLAEMWGPAIDNTNIPTVLANGGHASLMGVLKHIFHPGFDDGVLGQNSVGTNPGTPIAWPQGFITTGFYGVLQTYDRGMKQSAPKRARKYFMDQFLDPALQPVTGPLPFYVAATENLYLSPAGMLQSVGLTFPNTPLDPLQRRNRHLSFMAGTSDHFSIRTAEFYPDYKPTNNLGFLEENWEEIRTIRAIDKPAFRLQYTPGPIAYAGDDQALLEAACTPPVRYSRMGRSVGFKIKIFGRKFEKRWWIWKRNYFRPANSASRHVCDYVYASILACGNGIPKCDVSSGVGSGGGASIPALSAPNPFAGELGIEFRLAQAGRVAIEIYDTQGRLVRAVADETYPAGTHHVRWNGRSDGGGVMPSGHYFWKLRLNGQETTTEKVLLLR